MKKLMSTALFVGMLLWVGSAWAVTITYTADNVVNAWYVQGSSGDAVSQGTGSNSTNWRVADTADLSLSPTSAYAFIWSVSNVGRYTNGNPAAFLAQIDVGYDNLVLTDLSWRYSIEGDTLTNFNDSSWNWDFVTGYGSNNSINIWRNNNGGQPVAGISNDAQWIWSDANFADGYQGNLFIRVDVRTASVPEPGTLLLLGSGLAGLALYRRRSMNK